MKVATLCYIINNDKVLLIKKKRGIGVGKWNGPGGKVEEGETHEKAAAREVYEETGLRPKNLERHAEIDFFFGKSHFMNVHVFRADDFNGIEIETEEAAPKWFHLKEIPYHEMWPDDKIWMPHMLSGKKFRAKFNFDEKGENIISYEIVEGLGKGSVV